MRVKLFLAILCLVLIGCGGGSDKQQATERLSPTLEGLNQSAQNVISAAGNTASKAIEKANEISKEAMQKAGEITENITQKTDSITQDISQKADKAAQVISKNIEEASQKGQEVLQKVDEKVSQTVDDISKTADQVAQKAQDVANAATSSLYDLENGKKVFKRCVPCHGAKANLSAVGKSQDISKWTKENIAQAMKGYKDGTYGGSTKATMTSMMKILSEKDITDVSSYIPTLGE
jgi:cytochrome c553